MKHAKKWLNCLRRGEYPYGLYMRFLREEVKNGCFFLEDIGTSEKELEELSKKGAAIAAKVWLGHIKEEPGHPRSTRFLAEEIKRGALAPADIGTTIEELTQLAPMAAALMMRR